MIALAFLRWFAYIEPYVCYHFFSIDALKGLFIPIAFTLLCLMHFEYIPSADIWFIPAILSKLNTIINMFAGSYLSVLSFITWIMFVGAMFMYGYICSGKTGQQGAALSVSPGSTVRTAQQTNNESRNIQELKAFFELYQDGVISEEEYMEKRKEILRR